MRRYLGRVLFVLAVSGLGLGCKDNTVNQANNTTNNFTTVGPEGAIVEGPNGARIEIPPGALRDRIDVGISVMADPGPPPGDTTLVGQAYEFTPHDTPLLVDATVSLPAPPGYYMVASQIGFGGWDAHEGAVGAPDAKGFVQFRTKQLARFALYARKPGRDFERRMLDADGMMTDVVVSSGHIFWSEYVDDTTKIFSLELDPMKTRQTIFTEKYERSELAAVDADYVYFRRMESNSLGRMKRDGSSLDKTWIADLGAAGFTGGSMLSARGYLYFGSKKVEIATGTVSEHGFGGDVNGPSRSSSPGGRCVPSPDGNKARCAWGEVDFVAGTSQTRTETVIPFASNGTHWITTASTKRPYVLRLEPHGTDAPIVTGLQIEADFSASAVAATSRHLYLSDCSKVHWVDLAAPTTAHTEEDVDSWCIQWMHVDEQYAFMKMGSGGLYRLTLDKIRSPT